MEELKYVIEDSTIAELLGVQNFSTDEAAILELVKNAYDANALNLKITFQNDTLRFEDNGIGMNADDIKKHWMHIGKSKELPVLLEQCVRNIFEVRKITAELQKNTSWEKVMVEKIVNSVNGQGKFDEFTKKDIDDVIKMFQELQIKVEE